MTDEQRKRGTELIVRASIIFKRSEEDFVKKRDFPLAYIRGMIYKTLAKENWSGSDIARLFGKNHATVFYWLARIEDMIEYNEPVKEFYWKYRIIEFDYE